MQEISKIQAGKAEANIKDALSRQLFNAMGANAQVVEWSHTHNMNDYKDAGTYRIKGERTGNPMSDNLPIMNQGSGHTIEGILYVLDSSLTNGSGEEDDCTITQFLMLSNRVGGQEGDMYMRSGFGANKGSLTWKSWEKYQTNMEVGVVSNACTHNQQDLTKIIDPNRGLDALTDNGIYSGVYLVKNAMLGTPPSDISIKDFSVIETFVMVVINNYAAAGEQKTITQVKYAVTNGGVFSMEQRSRPLGAGFWSQWESVGGGNYPLIFGDSFGDDSSKGRVYFGYDGNGWSNGTSVVICKGVKLDTNVSIKHDTEIAQRVSIGSDVTIKGATTIEKYVTIGEHANIGNDVVIRSRGASVPIILGTSGQSTGFNTTTLQWGILIGTGVRIWNDSGQTGIGKDLTSSSTPVLHIYHKDGKIHFYCEGKTASIQLT